MEKTVKYNFAFWAAEDAGEEIEFDCFKFEIFYSGTEVSTPHSNVPVTPNFPSFSRGPLETWCEPLEGHTAHAKKEFRSHIQIQFLPQYEHPAPKLQRLVG